MKWVSLLPFCFTLSFAQMTLAEVPAEAYKKYLSLYKRPKDTPFPEGNAFSKAREDLGRTLFFDTRLSSSDFISCGTCHNPAYSWGDGLGKGIGHGMKQLGRRTPTILNLAWGQPMFWDGRADGLEEQALGPIASAGEMNLPLEELESKVRGIGGYKELFAKAYPGEAIDRKTIAKAIATFERTVVSGEAPFDRWVKGDEKAVSDSAKRGFVLFNEKANCAVCHSGWRFTDDGFHDIGVPGQDIGRGNVLKEIDSVYFAFKTPTLRNVDHRAPYLHDGSEKNLVDLIEFYNQGGKEKRPSLSEEVKVLNLTADEKADLLAFLKSLTSTDKSIAIPVLPR